MAAGGGAAEHKMCEASSSSTCSTSMQTAQSGGSSGSDRRLRQAAAESPATAAAAEGAPATPPTPRLSGWLACCSGLPTCFEGFAPAAAARKTVRLARRRLAGPGRGAVTDEEFQRRIDFLGQVPLFKQMPLSHYPVLARELRGVRWEAGQVVVETGAQLQEFALIAEGTAEVQVGSSDFGFGSPTTVRRLRPGDYFGERALQTAGGLVVKSPARIVAGGDGLVTLAMSPEEFEDYGLRQHLSFPKRRALSRCALKMDRFFEGCPKTAEQRSFISEALRRNQNLRSLVHLTEDAIQQMIDAATRQEVSEGTQVVQRGDYGGMFYIVESGRFELRLSSEGDVLQRQPSDALQRLPSDALQGVGAARLWDPFEEAPTAKLAAPSPPASKWQENSETHRRRVRKERFLQKLAHTQDEAFFMSHKSTDKTPRGVNRDASQSTFCASSGSTAADGSPQRSVTRNLSSPGSGVCGDLPNLLPTDSGGSGATPKRSMPTSHEPKLVRAGSLHSPAVDRLLRHGQDEDESDPEAARDGVLGVRTCGDSFGELALLYHAPRTSTAVAAEDSVVWCVSQMQFRRIMTNVGREKTEEVERKLGRVDLFQGLLSEEKAELAQNLMTAKFKKGDWLAKEGETQQVWYLITGGELAMSRSKAGQQEPLGRLAWPSHFGERALLRRRPSEFAVQAVSDEVECLVLDGPTFRELAAHLSPEDFRRAADDDLVEFARFKHQRRASPTDGFLSHQAKTGPGSSGCLGGRRLLSSPGGGLSIVDPATGAHEALRTVGVLGRGGFGVVSLEEDPATKRRFALKKVSKQHIIAQDLQKAVKYERQILSMMDSPFIIRLFATFKDDAHLYFLFEPLLGGELHKHMVREPSRFRDPRVYRFVLACVTNALGYLHERSVLFRDLKPENVLIDSSGYLKLCDLGFAKFILGKTHSLLGTPEYIAPEVIMMVGYDRMVDWWALGVLTFECCCGVTPFLDEDASGDPRMIFNNIIMTRVRDVEIPRRIGRSTAKFIAGLLDFSPGNRLGSGGPAQVKSHDFFSGFDWNALEAKRMQAPYLPKIKSDVEFGRTLKHKKGLAAPCDELGPGSRIHAASLDQGWDADF